jgi:CxxC motif-containing protein (DUF1111 family)
VITFALATVVASCGGSDGRAHDSADSALGARTSGGGATVNDRSMNAFSFSVPSLDRPDRRAFAVGNSFFKDNWVVAPASTEGRDGLGPLFNATSCSTCHLRDGRGRPPSDADDPERSLLFRLSVPGSGAHGTVEPDPVYGDQLQDRAIGGVPAEATVVTTTREVRGHYADGTPYTLLAPSYTIVDPAYGPLADDALLSPRVAPSVFGVGLLEAVPESAVRDLADPSDADGDGISGRPNTVWDFVREEMRLGRFGWKANVPSVELQTAGAFNGDIGITSGALPDDACTARETECSAAPSGGEPELDAQKLDRVTFYTRTLAVPARRSVRANDVREGERLFRELGCSSCHVPTLRTGDSDIPELAHQTIHPYTDLLLHDMGPDLADDRPDGRASGSEWRTPPLWGIGLVETVNGHTRFLHDGRARDLTEAILWHGGESRAARNAFRQLSRPERSALVKFLESL